MDEDVLGGMTPVPVAAYKLLPLRPAAIALFAADITQRIAFQGKEDSDFGLPWGIDVFQLHSPPGNLPEAGLVVDVSLPHTSFECLPVITLAETDRPGDQQDQAGPEDESRCFISVFQLAHISPGKKKFTPL
jgi:hypothetical protein